MIPIPAPIKPYLYGAIIAAALAGVAYISHVQDRAESAEKALTLEQAARENVEAAILSYAGTISTLEARYEMERDLAAGRAVTITKHNLAPSLSRHPKPTLGAINNATSSLFGALACASDLACDPAAPAKTRTPAP